MRNLCFISLLFLFSIGILTAQCELNEVEIKVEIDTDNWGHETSWQLLDIVGTVILEGGQGGVYDSHSSYADSVCVSAEGCFFFEIYDTYGDGIIAPDGYALYVDEVLVSTGANDIQSFKTETAYCPSPCSLTLEALNDLKDHLNGVTMMSVEDLSLIRNVFFQFPECLAENKSMILLAKSVVADYDDAYGALFTNSKTVNGFSKDPTVSTGLDVEHAMVALQQGILDDVFTPEIFNLYPALINDWKFNTCYTFPGYVSPPADSSLENSIMIRANFADPDGMNAFYDINGDGTDHALRPTGMYLSPGSISTVTVPESLVDQGYFVRVGSHEWDLGIRPIYKRLDRISKKFPIDSTTIEVFNPLGGAISILVPFGANQGIVNVSVNNGVECPFFSIKSFYETEDFNAELNKPGPWAVFETDNVMYTIPSHSIIPGEYDLKQSLLDWDAAVQGINSVMARQIVSDKHNMYMIADITIRHNVYSIGYPMSNTPLRFTSVPGPAYFIDGPGGEGENHDSNDETNFHEYGHSLAMSKFPGEVEALVNVPYIMALNHGLGQELDIAVKNSFPPYTFKIDETATHRMASNSFGTERIIVNATTNEVRYQHRGYGHYFEIVNMFGWCPLRNFWKQESIDAENGIDYGLNNQDIDLRTLRMSVAAEADLRPLFHVFGILPQDSIALQDTLVELGIGPSHAIYSRLQEYFDLIPADKEEFIDYALTVYPNLYTDGPSQNPDYGVGWHYQKSLTYDKAEAADRTAILQSIIDLYFPNGSPSSTEIPDVCCILDTLILNYEGGEVNVAGGVAPFDINIDTTDNMYIVNVTDFDGCESTVQYTISNVKEEDNTDINIYPNPAFGEINIQLVDNNNPIDQLMLYSINGQKIRQYYEADGALDISMLNEGFYLLKISLADGSQYNKRILILRK